MDHDVGLGFCNRSACLGDDAGLDGGCLFMDNRANLFTNYMGKSSGDIAPFLEYYTE
jgi:hypothetical protein